MQDIKSDIETKEAEKEREKEKEKEKAKEAALNSNSSEFFSADTIKNLLIKHNNSINSIERTLKKMI